MGVSEQADGGKEKTKKNSKLCGSLYFPDMECLLIARWGVVRVLGVADLTPHKTLHGEASS